ncbi:MAG: hypothetical protein Q9227_005874 [Pyrenula ochraceoflavens]
MFSVVLPGRPCLSNPTTIQPNQFAFSFPAQPSFSHLVVFLNPGAVLPAEAAAGVYIQFPNISEFRLLGAIAQDKQSAIFQVHLPSFQRPDDQTPEIAMSDEIAASGGSVSGVINVGISVEPAANIQAQLSSMQADSSNTALVRRPPSTKVLAQRIIKNAFNFLASFSGGSGGNETIPLRSFQDWWTKFERRIDSDPGFLEREVD